MHLDGLAQECAQACTGGKKVIVAKNIDYDADYD